LDFWDLTRLLLRRWYFAVPALALTAIASVWTMVGVPPNYVASAYVQLAPPISQPSAPGTQSLDQRNPWIALGMYNLANAAILTVQQAGVVESLKASGYSESFTATLNSSSPLVTFEVTGSSPKQAIDTTNELIQRFTTSVRDLQVDTYGVSTNDLVVARRIDSGTNIAESDGRVKRALVAVAGLGLLLTLAFTVGMDALLGRRARRSAGLPPGVGMADLSPPPSVTTPSATRPPNGGVDRAVSFGRASRPDSQAAASRGDTRRRQPKNVPPTGPVAGPESDGAFVSPVQLESTPDPAGDGAVEGIAEGTLEEDATVVLPLTHRSLRRRGADEKGTRPR
jgi:hypothetical protein